MSLKLALTILRVVTPALFMVHSITRITLGTIGQFGVFMESRGFPNGAAWVWAITITELVAGTAIIVGYRVRWMVVPLFIIAATGIVLIHGGLGWFVGEFGSGGSEYSVALMVMLVVLGAADLDRQRELQPRP